MKAPAQDAFGLIFQLKALPEHDFWQGTTHKRVAAGPSGSLSIFDMNGGASSHITSAFDSLGLCIPRAALDAFTDDAAMSRIGSLEMPDMWEASDPTIASLSVPLTDLLADKEPGNRLLCDHLVLALLSHVTVTYGGAAHKSLSHSGGLAAWQERRAMEMLDGSGSALSLADVARECRISLAHFSRAFRATTGVTPHGWLQRQRVERSKAMLLNSYAPLAEIAIVAGFADQSHFTKAFANVVGSTPGAWRRQRARH